MIKSHIQKSRRIATARTAQTASITIILPCVLPAIALNASYCATAPDALAPIYAVASVALVAFVACAPLAIKSKIGRFQPAAAILLAVMMIHNIAISMQALEHFQLLLTPLSNMITAIAVNILAAFGPVGFGGLKSGMRDRSYI
jgi:hypothetical protein